MTRHPTVLVAYATAQGSTETIAECIRDTLADSGCTATAASVDDDLNPGDYEAVVLGSTIHDGNFLPAFTDYIDRHREELRDRPTWLFSVGMGPAMHGPLGSVLRRVIPKPIDSVRHLLGAKGFHAFAGVFDRPPTWQLRLVVRLLGVHPGDHRDRTDIATWTDDIAAQLL
jgi:menaquinone-dependent protoporphyrinogen oxidase